MGNTCCAGRNVSKNERFQSDSAKGWTTKSLEQQPPLSIQYDPTEQTKIQEPEKKIEQELVEPKKKMKRDTDFVLQRKTEKLEDLFTLGEKLGQGQLGTVFVCIDKGSGERYACKSIAKSKLLTDDDVEDVRREIQIMHLLGEHPNVVSIKGEYEDAVAVHIVMELCAGGELFDRIVTSGHYTERKAAEVTRTIVGVVEACHSLGVMHRDLKPENFLLMNEKEDAVLKAIDFGLSVFFKPGESFHDKAGSPYYVAPEVLEKNYGPEVDVWSAGVILYILLCAVPPFWAETQEGIFEQVQHGDLDLLSTPWLSISDGAKDLVRRMLDRDPKRRLTAHEVLCHPWVQVNGVAPHKPLDSPSRLKHFSSMNKLKKMAIVTSPMTKVDGNGTTDGGEIETKVDGNGTIDGGKMETNVDGNGTIYGREIEKNVDGNGTIDSGEMETTVDGNGTTDGGEMETIVDGNGTTDGGEIETNVDDNGTIDGGEIETNVDANGTIDRGEIETNVDGHGTTDGGEIKTNVDGNGTTDGGEIETNVDGNGTIDGEEIVAGTLHISEIEKDNHLFLACSYFGNAGSVYYN